MMKHSTQGFQLLLWIILLTIVQSNLSECLGDRCCVSTHILSIEGKSRGIQAGWLCTLLVKSRLPLWLHIGSYPIGSRCLDSQTRNPRLGNQTVEEGGKEYFCNFATRTFQELFREVGGVDTRLSEREQGRTLIWKHFTLCAWQCMLCVKKKKNNSWQGLRPCNWIRAGSLVAWLAQ